MNTRQVLDRSGGGKRRAGMDGKSALVFSGNPLLTVLVKHRDANRPH
jgi:hypothetical protein